MCGAERSVAQCMFRRSVIVSSNRFKPYDLGVTRLYSLWPDSTEYVLLLNVFIIKCNYVHNLTMIY